jgi:hypothetical protein
MRTTYIRLIAERRRAIVIDEDVDAAVMCDGLGHDLGAIRRVAAVGRQRQRLDAGFGADLLARLAQDRLTPRGDRELGAFGRERSRDAEADALAGAADNGDLVLKL